MQMGSRVSGFDVIATDGVEEMIDPLVVRIAEAAFL